MEKSGTTTLLCSNIHCPSCVKTIDETLRQLGDAVLEISTSTVTQIVSVKHKETITPQALATALYDAGFDVQSLWEQRSHSRASMFSLAWLSPDADTSKPAKLPTTFQEFSCGMLKSPEQTRAHREMHSTYCKECASGRHVERTDSRALLTADPQPFGSIPEEPIKITASRPSSETYNVVLALGGLTCSACVGRVQEVLETKPYVRKVNVNLLSQSASILVEDASKAAELAEEVEDIGYEATLESCEPVRIADKQAQVHHDSDHVDKVRTVSIQIQDMYCEHCPPRIVAALRTLSHDVEILQMPALPSGTMTIRYMPSAPEFTIRHILMAFRQADPKFKPRVYQPPSLEERAHKLQREHQIYLLSRLTIAVLAAIPTFTWGVVVMSLLPQDNPVRQYWMDYWIGGRLQAVQLPLLVLATIVYFCCAEVFHRRAIKELYMMWRPGSKVPFLRRFYRFGSMDMLLSLGTTVAYVGSIIVLILEATKQLSQDTDTSTYFDAVVFLTMFLLMGRLLEAYGKAKTADAVSALTRLKAKEALLLVQDSTKNEGNAEQNIQSVPVDELEVDDVVVVPPGAAPPCDGHIVFGTSSFDESSLTGESKANARGIGDTAFAGTINLTNAVHVKLTATAGSSMLDNIIDTVREGQAKRAPIERFADILTGYFVPLIVLIALLDWLVWTLIGYAGMIPYVQIGTGGWVFWSLQFAIAVLVVACPCGIGLAAPTALFIGTGLAAKHGILVKGGGEAFQEASGLDMVVFDKTGTITKGGAPKITDELWLMQSERGLIQTALLQLESHSSHPLAAAMVDYCKAHAGVESVTTLLDVKEVPGLGMMGVFDTPSGTFSIVVGNERLIQDHDIFLAPDPVECFRQWSVQAKTAVFVGVKLAHQEWQLAAMVAAWDPVRTEAPQVIKALRADHVDVWILTGDNRTTAQAVASSVGIDAAHVIAEVLPHQKAEKIQMLQRSCQKSRGRGRATVAMVGDGINDAPALAMADVGIAMGSGSDTAISSADFVLLTSELTAVLTLVRLSKVILRRVKFNFAWAIGYNLIMLPFAAGVLYPVVSNGSHVRLDPVWASLAMALSSISVVMSSLLLKTKLPVAGFRSS